MLVRRKRNKDPKKLSPTQIIALREISRVAEKTVGEGYGIGLPTAYSLKNLGLISLEAKTVRRGARLFSHGRASITLFGKKILEEIDFSS